MQIPEMLERLSRASAEIQAVEEHLNDRVNPCATCGCKVREDFTEYQLRESFAAVRNKIKRLAGSLYARQRVQSASTTNS